MNYITGEEEGVLPPSGLHILQRSFTLDWLRMAKVR